VAGSDQGGGRLKLTNEKSAPVEVRVPIETGCEICDAMTAFAAHMERGRAALSQVSANEAFYKAAFIAEVILRNLKETEHLEEANQ
jgi:hypothetical protein